MRSITYIFVSGLFVAFFANMDHLAIARPVSGQPKGSITIADDFGGSVEYYNKRFTKLEASGKKIIIKGACYSACARFMKLTRVCAKPHAAFVFHAITLHDKVLPEYSRIDSEQTDTPAALALETKYDTFHMGFTNTRPYISEDVEPGVRIVYQDAAANRGHAAYQVFLFVDADKLVPACP